MRAGECPGGPQTPWPRPGRVAALAPAVIALLVQVPPTLVIGLGTGTPVIWVILKTLLAAVSAGALVLAWRHPGPTVTIVAPLALVLLFLPPQLGPPPIALGFTLVIALVRAAPLWALVSAGSVWVLGVSLAELVAPAYAPRRIIAGTVALAVCLGIGLAIRTRTERARRREHELEERRREAEQQERAQIARELHDVLAHSLSQISVQSGVGLHLFDRDPEQAREALANIRGLAGTGLDEARGVLATLRGEEAPLTPQPQLADLSDLLAQHAAGGLDVRLSDELGGALPAGAVQTAAYRIVREALTNIVRHSAADRADIRLRRHDDALLIEVDDDGLGTGSAPTGAGTRGMRERAELAGGSLDILPGPRGRGTRVVARLPWTEVPA